MARRRVDLSSTESDSVSHDEYSDDYIEKIEEDLTSDQTSEEEKMVRYHDDNNDQHGKKKKIKQEPIKMKHRRAKMKNKRQTNTTTHCKQLERKGINHFSHDLFVPKNAQTLMINIKRRNQRTISLIAQFNETPPKIIHQSETDCALITSSI